jgi:hypothetical protein
MIFNTTKRIIYGINIKIGQTSKYRVEIQHRCTHCTGFTGVIGSVSIPTKELIGATVGSFHSGSRQ